MNKKNQPAAKTEDRPKPKVGEIVDIDVVTLDSDGYGLGTFLDRPLLINGVLPGERVKAKITFTGRKELFADTIKILRPSPARMKRPVCPHAKQCDGCPLIAMAYPAQLAWKQELVRGEAGHFSSLADTQVHNILPSPRPLHYRNSAKLVIAGKFNAPVIGIYRRNSHDVTDISDCPLHHPLINRIAAAVKEGIRKGKVPIYSPRSSTGFLRYLVIRVSETENRAMAIIVTAERSFNEIHHLAKYLRAAVPEVSVVVQNVNGSAGNAILGDKDFSLTSSKELTDRIGDVRFSISPRSFFQVNSGSARLIYEKVREYAELTGRETIIDLYCGVGGISLFLAGGAKEVIGIESVAAAVADAEKNCRLNDVNNCRFMVGDAARLLEEIRKEGNRIDLIVLNPPRKGCDEQVLRDTALMAPARIIYVSCSPRTLTRDLDLLSGFGYRTREIQPVDMFPQTPHIENVAILEPHNPASAAQT
jgi:23S rRNA (uracil1939-C5)-methyltransferase